MDISETTNTVTWDHFQVGAVFEENRAGILLRIYSDSGVGDHCAGRWIHIELLGHKFDDCGEGRSFWH